MIAIVNVGTGNIRSIYLALQKVAPTKKICVISDPLELKNANKVVFPGQGSMLGCVQKLKKNGFYEEIMYFISDKPFLGICLGKQILFNKSEEGNSLGLGLLSGEVVRFNKSKDAGNLINSEFKIPHMGWNQVKIKKNHYIFKGFNDSKNFQGHKASNWFYFVHSFFVKPDDPNITLAQTNYGRDFTSVVAQDNIVATQFHPEKSSKSGLLFLENFISWKL